jgi:hypothetical protein
VGSTTWGHVTGVGETNTRPFAGVWTGTGSIHNSGDDEYINLDETEFEEGEVVNIGANSVKIEIDLYGTGSGPAPTIKYKDGDTYANCLADTWNTYTGAFASTGFVQIRVEH